MNSSGSFYKVCKSQKSLLKFFLIAFLVLVWSCKRESSSSLAPKLGPTKAVTNIKDITAECGGNIESIGGGPVLDKGLCFGTALNPTIADSGIVSAGAGSGSITAKMQGLMPATTYNVRTYATNAYGTSYGESVTFTTKNPMTPVLRAPSIIGVTKQTSVTILSNVAEPGGSIIKERGICLDTIQIPTVKGFHVTDFYKTTGSFQTQLSTNPGKRYYARTYATNESGTAYSEQITIKTPAGPTPVINVPNVTVNGSKISVKVSFADGGDYTPLTKGICYTNFPPTPHGLWTLNISLPRTTVVTFKSNPDTGTFSYNLTGLLPDTIYYLCGWAVNSRTPKPDTTYGNGVRFRTPPALELPKLTKTTVDTIGGTNYIVLGGIIKSDGGSAIKKKGVCFSFYPYDAQSPPLEIENWPHIVVTVNDPTVGNFAKRFLIKDVTSPSFSNYITRVQAYATNDIGTAYAPPACFDASGPTTCD